MMVFVGIVHFKSSKGSFPSSDNWSKGILDMVPSNACGPRTISSLGDF